MDAATMPSCGDPERRLTGRAFPLYSPATEELIQACLRRTPSPLAGCKLREALWTGPEAPAAMARFLCPVSDWIAAARRAGVEEAPLEVIVADRLLAKLALPEPPLQAVRSLMAQCEYREGKNALSGDEVLVVLAGNLGVGKTVAASYAVAHLGGRYTTAYDWTAPRELAPLEEARVLVVDQLGREYASEYVLTQLERVVHKRHAARRLTLLVGNLTRKQFSRYQGVIEDRLRERGAFLEFGGASLRGRV